MKRFKTFSALECLLSSLVGLCAVKRPLGQMFIGRTSSICLSDYMKARLSSSLFVVFITTFSRTRFFFVAGAVELQY